MARIRANKGIEDVAQLLVNVQKEGTSIAKAATYEGARVIADGIRESTQKLPAQKHKYLTGEEQFDVISDKDKEDLLHSIGVAEIKKDEDGVKTVVGFAGYGRFPTRKYPRGLPMPLLARAIESGSSVRRAQPFVRPTAAAKRAEAKAAMIKKGNEMIKNMTKT